MLAKYNRLPSWLRTAIGAWGTVILLAVVFIAYVEG